MPPATDLLFAGCDSQCMYLYTLVYAVIKSTPGPSSGECIPPTLATVVLCLSNMASAVAFLRSLWSIRAWILLVLAFVLPCQLIIEATPVSKNLLLTQSIYFLSICFSFLLCLTNPSPLNNLCVLQADSILFITLKRRILALTFFGDSCQANIM